MPEPLETGRARVRALLVDTGRLVKAVGSGRRRGEHPDPERVDLRVVDLRSGAHLQVVARTGARVSTRNVPVADGPALAEVVDELLDLPLGNWHVETSESTLQLRVTKRGEAQIHVTAADPGRTPPPGGRAHDRVKDRLIDPGDPLFDVLGADADKRRQVDAFLRLLAPAVDKAFEPGRPLRVVDLGCGNAYLTFAAHRFLTAARPGTRTVGIELRADLVAASRRRAQQAGLTGLTFVQGSIGQADPGLPAVDVVLALHACDTATDEALARAVGWQAPVVLAAPCCHHDIQRQLTGRAAAELPAPYRPLTRFPILRERLADVLTDTLRAGILREHGYRVDVVEFIDSRHTPRNALIRARFTGRPAGPAHRAEYAELREQWALTPALAVMLGDDPPPSPVVAPDTVPGGSDPTAALPDAVPGDSDPMAALPDAVPGGSDPTAALPDAVPAASDAKDLP